MTGSMPRPLLRLFIEQEFPGRIALVSSFGSEAAVLLHMAAEIDRRLPVIFLDTGKLFGETLRYRDQLVRRLGLTDLRIVKPERRGACRGRSRQPALPSRSRCLLRPAQGGAAEAGAGRLRCLDLRAQALSGGAAANSCR